MLILFNLFQLLLDQGEVIPCVFFSSRERNAFYTIINTNEKVHSGPSLPESEPESCASYLFSFHGADVPRKKQTDSERLHRSMLGATFPRTRPICSSLVSPVLRTSLCEEEGQRRRSGGCRNLASAHAKRSRTWYSRTKMKMLSAPTASTRKGTTWRMTSEEGMPIQE